MNKNQNILSIMIAMVIFISISTSAFSQSNNEELLYDPEEKIIGTIGAASNLFATRSSSYKFTVADEKYNNIKAKLKEYGINFSDVDMNIRKISSPKNDEIYYKIIFGENNMVDVDSEGNILKVKILGDDRYIKSNYNVKNKVKEDMESRGYKLLSDGYIDQENDIISMEFQKEVSQGVYNPYESVSAIIDEKNNCLHGLNVRDNQYTINNSIISEEEALKAITKTDETIDSSGLTIVKPKDYTIDNTDSTMRLAYIFKSKSSYYYVDANTGELLGSSDNQSKDGKSFSITTNWNGKYIGNMGHNGLTKLGYNMKPRYISSDFGNQLKDFLRSSGTEKGIFVNCHGNPTCLSDNRKWYMDISELDSINSYNRKCRFAYFNSCKGAYDNRWAEKLGIVPGKWGAFVGWSINVDQAKGVLFAERFWRYADGNRPILKAVELGASDMPSSYYVKDGQDIYDDNTTIRVSSPIGIRFIGNKTFYGNGK